MTISTKYGEIHIKLHECTRLNTLYVFNIVLKARQDVKLIAEGNNSVLLSVEDTNKVIKVNSSRRHAEREVSIYGTLNHPNIIKLYSVITIWGYIAMELEKCDVDFLEICSQIQLSMEHIKEIARVIANVLAYLHSNDIVYLDLKPENILLSIIGSGENRKEEIKLCDFEHAHRFTRKDERTRVSRGTIPYSAPELYMNKYYRYEPDIWSFGVTLFTIHRQAFLFSGDMDSIICLICNYNGESLGNDPLDQLIRECLVPMDRRLTIDGVLSHPFLVNT